MPNAYQSIKLRTPNCNVSIVESNVEKSHCEITRYNGKFKMHMNMYEQEKNIIIIMLGNLDIYNPTLKP
jgi:hypothetical protein